MANAEPAMVDVHGAVWTSRHDYQLVPSAKRYELYEMSYAAKASHFTCVRMGCYVHALSLSLILRCTHVPVDSITCLTGVLWIRSMGNNGELGDAVPQHNCTHQQDCTHHSEIDTS